MIDGRVDEVDAADEVVRIVEALDEVAQAFRSVRRQVKHVGELAGREQPVDQRGVCHAALDKLRACRHVVGEPSAQVVQHRHAAPPGHQVPGDM